MTANFVLLETRAMLLRSIGRNSATPRLLELESGSLVVHRAVEVDERNARQLLLRYSDKDFSLVDATSFVIMDRIGIREAFTYDNHFRQYGLTVVEPAL